MLRSALVCCVAIAGVLDRGALAEGAPTAPTPAAPTPPARTQPFHAKTYHVSDGRKGDIGDIGIISGINIIPGRTENDASFTCPNPSPPPKGVPAPGPITNPPRGCWIRLWLDSSFLYITIPADRSATILSLPDIETGVDVILETNVNNASVDVVVLYHSR